MTSLNDWKTEILGNSGGILKFINVGIQDPLEIRSMIQSRFLLLDWEHKSIDDKMRWLLEEEYKILYGAERKCRPSVSFKY